MYTNTHNSQQTAWYTVSQFKASKIICQTTYVNKVGDNPKLSILLHIIIS